MTHQSKKSPRPCRAEGWGLLSGVRRHYWDEWSWSTLSVFNQILGNAEVREPFGTDPNCFLRCLSLVSSSGVWNIVIHYLEFNRIE